MMRVFIVSACLLLPASALAVIGLAQSEAGPYDLQAPQITLISPAEGEVVGGNHVVFVWDIAEDSPAFDAGAIRLTVRSGSSVLLEVEFPYEADGAYIYSWFPEQPLPEGVYWEVWARDRFGNADTRIMGPFVPTDAPDLDVPVLGFGECFPNPFNPLVRIRFSVPEEQEVRLRVFDLAGREVAVLASGVLSPGWHELPWNAQSLASGQYMARLQSGDQTRTIKLMLLK
jgi:hypothetical protein